MVALAASTTLVQSCDLVTNRYPLGKVGAGIRIRLTSLANIARAFVTLCVLISAPLSADEDWYYSNVDRIVAVSDVHGAYDALVATLQVAEVIDDELSWSGGNTHFVITGDLLDRGPDSRLAMDLIMRLEMEAPQAGGRVHQLLGNHEVMNLIGDLRYVSDEEYAAFLDIESTDEREYWYREFQRSKPVDSDEEAIRFEFNEKAPPGYFGHRRAFRRDGIYGRWLLQKPIMVVINDTVFVHGGIPPYVAEHGITGINVGLKNDLHEYVTTRELLTDAAILSPIVAFKEAHLEFAASLNSGQLKGDLVYAAKSLGDLTNSPLHRPTGPTWYRGTATCGPLIEGDRLNDALEELGATRVVIGHTPTVTRRVQQRMDGRIVEIDTGMLKANYQGSGNALVIENDELSVVNQDGTQYLSPLIHPIRIGSEFFAADGDLEKLLSYGSLIESTAGEVAWKLLQVTDGDKSVFAYFDPLPSESDFAPELAAYKLDRLLGLGMVPVTVQRVINGRRGTLQVVPSDTLTESVRVASREGDSASCSVRRQKEAMYIFDSLIQNPNRSPASMLYSPDEWQLILIEHGDSFGEERGKPSYLENVEFEIGDQWRNVLLNLNHRSLRDELGDALSDSRLRAIVERRDIMVGATAD